jgi:hypothetical protein
MLLAKRQILVNKWLFGLAVIGAARLSPSHESVEASGSLLFCVVRCVMIG